MKLRTVLFVVGIMLFIVQEASAFSPYDSTTPDGWTQYPENPNPGGSNYIHVYYPRNPDYSWVIWFIVLACIVFFIFLVFYALKNSSKKGE